MMCFVLCMLVLAPCPVLVSPYNLLLASMPVKASTTDLQRPHQVYGNRERKEFYRLRLDYKGIWAAKPTLLLLVRQGLATSPTYPKENL